MLCLMICYLTVKSLCMKLVAKSQMKMVPTLSLMGSEISFVGQCKDLGTIIYIKKNSDSDMKRQVKRLYASSNTSIHTFSKCSYHVKIMLFKSYCTNLYCHNSGITLLNI